MKMPRDPWLFLLELATVPFQRFLLRFFFEPRGFGNVLAGTRQSIGYPGFAGAVLSLESDVLC